MHAGLRPIRAFGSVELKIYHAAEFKDLNPSPAIIQCIKSVV